MLNWFMHASSLVKVLVIGVSAVVAISVVAIPTALITVAATNQSQAPTDLSQRTSTPAQSKAVTSGTPSTSKSSSAVPSTSPDKSKTDPSQKPLTVNQENAPNASNLEPPAPAPAPALATAPTNISLGGRGCATDLDGSGNCGTSVYFTAPSDSGSGTITGYQIGYSTNGGASWSYVTAIYNPSAGQPDWDSGPTLPADGANLLICIRAITSYGAGASSSYVSFQ